MAKFLISFRNWRENCTFDYGLILLRNVFDVPVLNELATISLETKHCIGWSLTKGTGRRLKISSKL